MPRISPITILQRTEQPCLFICTRSKVEDLPKTIGESYKEIAHYLDSNNLYLADIPYTAYHNMDMKDLDVEMGFPIAAPFPGNERIQAGSIPTGKYAFCLYLGNYSEIGPTYEEMMKWMSDNGIVAEGVFYEFYYNDPEETKEEYLLTKILIKIK